MRMVYPDQLEDTDRKYDTEEVGGTEEQTFVPTTPTSPLPPSPEYECSPSPSPERYDMCAEMLTFISEWGSKATPIDQPIGESPGWLNKKAINRTPGELLDILWHCNEGNPVVLHPTAVLVMLLTKNLPWHKLEPAIATVDLTQEMGKIACRLRGRAIAKLLSDEKSSKTQAHDVARGQTLSTIGAWTKAAAAFGSPVIAFVTEMTGLNVKTGRNEGCLERFLPGAKVPTPTESEREKTLEALPNKRSKKPKEKYLNKETRQQTRSNRDRETSRGGGSPPQKIRKSSRGRESGGQGRRPLRSPSPPRDRRYPPPSPRWGRGHSRDEETPETAHLTAKEPERRRQRRKILEYEPSEHPVKGPQARTPIESS